MGTGGNLSGIILPIESEVTPGGKESEIIATGKLGDIAKENNTSPQRLYEVMVPEQAKPSQSTTYQGSGLGRKTLETICSEQGISLEGVLNRLRQKGIDAQPGDNIKDLATIYKP